MPELPEVETTRLGILPHVRNRKVTQVIVRNRNLRWPVPQHLNRELAEQVVTDVQRRAKYLLLTTAGGTLIIHLGMSGRLHVIGSKAPPGKHDHIDIYLNNSKILRFNDPRRFGSVLWTRRPPLQHKLLASLGPEPLSVNFNGNYLYEISRNRKVAIKNLIMNSQIVVGVGNIYASESLYLAGINPQRRADTLTEEECLRLVDGIQCVLQAALKSGGSTLRDFARPNGKPGYFQHHFKVYGKAGESCEQCGDSIHLVKLGQRSTYFCPTCQI